MKLMVLNSQTIKTIIIRILYGYCNEYCRSKKLKGTTPPPFLIDIQVKSRKRFIIINLCTKFERNQIILDENPISLN